MPELRLYFVEAAGAKAAVVAETAQQAEPLAFERTGIDAFRRPLIGRTRSCEYRSMSPQVLMAATEDEARTWGR